jgi:methylglutaconyl-CoA hydratase
MSEPLVLTDSTNPQVTVLTLNRPAKRNALSLALMTELLEACRSVERNGARRVIILRGAGPSFCAGLDLDEAARGEPAESARTLKLLYETICLSPLVTIAAAHGAAMGGGAGLVAACDLAIAADDLQLAFPEVRRGLVAALVTCLIRRQVGDRTARELILLGRTVGGEEAMALRLVNRVVSPADLQTASIDMACTVCRGAPAAVARSKQLLDRLPARPICEELQAALSFHLEARHSAESAEGIAAFKERREPRWPHRF